MTEKQEKMIEDLKKVNKEIMEIFPGQFINRDLYQKYGVFSKTEIAQEFGSFSAFKDQLCDDQEIVEMNVKLAKQKQKFQDINRIERKSFRDQARLDNVLEEYTKELIEILKKYDLSKNIKISTKKDKIKNNDIAGIITLSDLHFNEYVENIGSLNNAYTWKIASQRLKKFADEIKIFFKGFNIKNVVIVNNGDLLNNDSIPDKYLTNISNRTKATVLGVYLLEQFILDLANDFFISVTTVSGNESRILPENTSSEAIATHNYDYTIHNMLKVMFRKSKNVEFIDGYYKEKVISICSQNILILHGDTIRGNIDRWIQDAIGRYAVSGVSIDFVVFGHIHSTHISDYFARSGSLVGANDYSDKALNMISKASQNCHVIKKDGTIHSIKIDLQLVKKDDVCYNVINELEAYNTKSMEKVIREATVHEITMK